MSRITGYLLVLAAAFFWGTCGVASKYCFNQNISPLLLLSVRLTLSGMLLFCILRVTSPRLLYLPKRERKQMVILGAIGVSTLQLTYLFTVSQLNVATAVFLQYLAPVLIAINAVVRKKEPLTIPWLVSLTLAVGGSALIIANQTTPEGDLWKGLLTGFCCAAAFAFYTLYSQKLLRNIAPWTVLTYGFLFGAVPCWLFVPLTLFRQQGFSPQIWLFFVYIAVFATILPYGLYLIGLRYINGARASLTATLEPVFAAVMAYLFLGEAMTALQITGCLLVMLAVVLLQAEGG